MSLEHILLGLLQEPASGYDLKACFDSSARYFWAAELSQIYPTLRRLERRGLLEGEAQPPNKGPSRKVYSLTAAGRKTLEDWVRQEPHLGHERHEFVAQLFFLDAASDLGVTLEYATRLRQTLKERLKTYERMEREWRRGEADYPDPESAAGFHQLMALRGGEHHMAARIKWCEEIIEAVRQRRDKKKRSGRVMGTAPSRKKKR